MVKRLSIAVALLVILACGGGDSGKEGIFFLENLVFVNGYAGPQELFLRKSPNGEVFQITHNRFNDFDPSLSRDGARVAFASDRTGDVEIFNMKLDGSNALRLTNSPGPDHSPAWSPNGKVILFVREVGGMSTIMRMNADGTSQSMFITDEGSQPCYNRSGTKVVFISNRTGNNEVWICDPSGGNETQVTFTSGNESSPTWSPTGDQLCFAYDNGIDSAIYRMNLDGSNRRVFFDTPGKADAAPRWGADGAFVAFHTESFAGSRDGQVFVVKAEGVGMEQVTLGSGGNTHPAVK